MNIFVGFSLTPQEQANLVHGAAPDCVFSSQGRVDEASHQHFLTCQIALGRAPNSWIVEANALRWIQLDSVGFDHLLELDWSTLSRNITVTNLAGFFANPVAETMLAGMLALYRGIDRLTVLKLEKSWRKMEIRPTLMSLHGAHVALAGFGNIAHRLVELLEPFHCTFSRLSRASSLANAGGLEEFDGQLSRADIVCCTLPETDQTRGFFNRRRIQLLKPGAIFCNVGRGAVVDEAALAEALQSGHLRGAVLDVTQTEPLPPDDPLWAVPNVILTQHTAGGSAKENLAKLDVFLANLRRFRHGELLAGVVDWQRGY